MRTTIRVPATTANLGPGFDCLGLALDIWNEFTFELVPDARGQTIEVHGFGEKELPGDSSNLVLQTFNRVYHRLGIDQAGVHVRSQHGFPIGSGLGSSASAIAAGVFAAVALLAVEPDRVRPFQTAVEIEGHPDNLAAALTGGLTVSMVDRDAAISAPAPTAEGWRVGVVVPQLGITTGQMRRALPEQVLFQDAVFNLGRTAMVLRAFGTGDAALLKRAMVDRLHQPSRLPLIPGAAAALEAAGATGAAAALSGAGPGVIAFSTSTEIVRDAVARMAAVFHTGSIGVWQWEGMISSAGYSQVTAP